jgi:Zn-finger nucleic acid-binding protein
MALHEINYKGINIDKYFSGDGVWLDAGELDVLAQLEKPAPGKLFNVSKR